LKPSIRTFLASCFCLASVIVYGQSGETPDPNRRLTVPAYESDPTTNSNIESQNINPSDISLSNGFIGSNDVIDEASCSTITYIENDGVIPIEDDISLANASDSYLIGATVHIYDNYNSDQDSLVFSEQHGIIGTYSRSEGKLQLSGEASMANYKKALSSVGYINTSEDPATEQRKVNFYADNGEDIHNFERIYIEVVAVNDPPIISGSESVLLYAPGSGAVEIDTMITIIDVDDSLIRRARIWISNGYKISEDLLTVAEKYGLTVTYDVPTAHLHINGYAPIYEYEDIMSMVTYENTNPEPEPSTRKVGFKVWDDDVRSNFHFKEIEILPVNLPPEIVGEDDNPIDTIYITTIQNIPVEVCVEANDPEGNFFAISSVISQTGNGSAGDLADLCFTFIPGEDFIGTDTLTVQVCDDGIPSKCDTVIVIADVEPEPDATPYIVNVTGLTVDTLYYETDEDVALDFCLYVEVPEGEELELGTISEAGDSTAHGSLNENEEGPFCFVYQPEENYFGQSSWIIKVCNDSIPQACDSVVVIIDVLPVNDPPVAVNDTVNAISNYTLTGNVTDNDYDIEGDELIVNENPEANPMHGAVVLHRDGTFEYTADPGYLGDDRFTYVVCDDGDPSLCASADVVITVDEVPLKVYNAVSPNGDDLNDFLYIEGIEYYPENVLSIYDRYNNLIYETPGYNNNNITWVGQANKGISTKDLPGDTYFYILNPGDGTPLLSGFIMLKVE
jgi:gliding motility-associated-like protein